MDANEVSNILGVNAGGLNIKKIRTLAGQNIEFLTGRRFSLVQWLKSVGRQYPYHDEPQDYYWDFSLSLGYYEVYTPRFMEYDDFYYMLELAVTTTTKYMILSRHRDFRHPRKVRVRYQQPNFKYVEVP